MNNIDIGSLSLKAKFIILFFFIFFSLISVTIAVVKQIYDDQQIKNMTDRMSIRIQQNGSRAIKNNVAKESLSKTYETALTISTISMQTTYFTEKQLIPQKISIVIHKPFLMLTVK